jgi:hypothetical protein
MIARWMAQAAQQNHIAEQGVRYAWVVTAECDRAWDHEDWRRDTLTWKNCDVAGPSDATEEEIALARSKGQPFRLMYDGDGPAAKGRIWVSDTPHARDSEACWQPLEDFGEGSYGCTEVQYRNAKGEWESL